MGVSFFKHDQYPPRLGSLTHSLLFSCLHCARLLVKDAGSLRRRALPQPGSEPAAGGPHSRCGSTSTSPSPAPAARGESAPHEALVVVAVHPHARELRMDADLPACVSGRIPPLPETELPCLSKETSISSPSAGAFALWFSKVSKGQCKMGPS